MSKIPFPLIEKEVGAVTYEHTYVQRLYDDIYIGDSERNYYVDRWNEINLCVHYNVRVPGKFKFIPEYQYYLTDGRMSLKLHWNGGIPQNDMVIERYDSIEAAEKSQFYKDFCELKNKIDSEINRQKKLEYNIKDFVSSSCRQYPSGESYYRITEIPPNISGCEYVQIHLDERSGQWKISKSATSIMTLWRYLKDFEEINERELQLMEYIQEDNEQFLQYRQWIEKVKKDYESQKEISYE